jgi:hypothetical protein
LLLVANRIDAKKTTIMTGTTKNGEVMFMASSQPLEYQKTLRVLCFLHEISAGSTAIGNPA